MSENDFRYVKSFENIRVHDVPSVGGKNSSLGELLSFGIPVPLGFAVTAKSTFRDVQEVDVRPGPSADLSNYGSRDRGAFGEPASSQSGGGR